MNKEIQVAAGETIEVVDAASEVQASYIITVGRDAKVLYRGLFTIDCQNIERNVTVICSEPGSSADIEISCHTTGSGSFSLTTTQRHDAARSTSSARILGASEDTSRVSVASTIYIAPHISAVAARQVHKQLLLDVGARAVSIPALDILSDDVSCSHGSAITYLDATQLFYLNARGYSNDIARKTLVKAFLLR